MRIFKDVLHPAAYVVCSSITSTCSTTYPSNYLFFLSLSLLPQRFALFFQLPNPSPRSIFFRPSCYLPVLNAPLSGAAINLTPMHLSTTLIDDADPSILLRWRDAGRGTPHFPLPFTLSFSLYLSHIHSLCRRMKAVLYACLVTRSHQLLYLSLFQAALSSVMR